MSPINRRPLSRASLFLLILLTTALFFISIPGIAQQHAPRFQASDVDGNTFSLEDYKGKALILYIPNIESPICRECEDVLEAQTRELVRLKEEHPEIDIATVNVRKNSYSKDGRSLAESWWGVDITWPWIEDFDPYPVSSKYVQYTTIEGGLSNPTILLIDEEGNIAAVYQVYQLGKGMIDGVRSADSLYADVQSIEKGEWAGDGKVIAEQTISYLGMFALGIITSLSPCSVALLIAVFSYIMTIRRKDGQVEGGASSAGEGLMIGVAFTLGMGAIFFIMGLFLSNIGEFVRGARFFDLAAGFLMITLGVNNIRPLREIFEPVLSRMPSRKNENYEGEAGKNSPMERFVRISAGLFEHSAFLGAFFLGIFFALGWAPCAISLVFPVLIWMISQDITPLAGGMLMLAFGVGHGVPVIPISTLSRSMGAKIGEKYISTGRWMTKLFGFAVIIVGIVFALRYFGFKLW